MNVTKIKLIAGLLVNLFSAISFASSGDPDSYETLNFGETPVKETIMEVVPRLLGKESLSHEEYIKLYDVLLGFTGLQDHKRAAPVIKLLLRTFEKRVLALDRVLSDKTLGSRTRAVLTSPEILTAVLGLRPVAGAQLGESPIVLKELSAVVAKHFSDLGLTIEHNTLGATKRNFTVSPLPGILNCLICCPNCRFYGESRLENPELIERWLPLLREELVERRTNQPDPWTRRDLDAFILNPHPRFKPFETGLLLGYDPESTLLFALDQAKRKVDGEVATATVSTPFGDGRDLYGLGWAYWPASKASSDRKLRGYQFFLNELLRPLWTKHCSDIEKKEKKE